MVHDPWSGRNLRLTRPNAVQKLFDIVTRGPYHIFTMTQGDTIRIGFIGAGSICRTRHLPGLAKIAGADVVAVCNQSQASSESVAHDFHIPEVEQDWKRLVARNDLDAIFIGTWPYMHREMSIVALESGKHVFCQARMCMDLAEAKDMVAAAQSHPKQVNMICPPPTRMPFELWVRHTIESGQLGQITAVELMSSGGANLQRDTVHWRERVEYSGKQIMAMGIYAETLNAWVGPYKELSARAATPIDKKTDESGNRISIGVPQVVTITGQLVNGAVAVEHHLGVATDRSTPTDRLTIWGLDGTIRTYFGNTIEFARAGEELKIADVPDHFQRDWMVEQDFIAAVRAARRGNSWQVSPDFAEGLLYMQKVEAVHRAAHTSQAVKISDL